MNNLIREKRRVIFDNKQITPTTIRLLSNIIDEESRTAKTLGLAILNFTVDATDGSSFESQSVIIFAENGIIEKKPIEKLSM